MNAMPYKNGEKEPRPNLERQALIKPDAGRYNLEALERALTTAANRPRHPRIARVVASREAVD